MTGLEGLQLDPDGFIDMDQFPDDGTTLSDADLTLLRDALHADPVDEPTSDQWDAMFSEAVGADDGGPFAVDAFATEAADTDGAGGTDDVDDVADPVDDDADTDVSDLAAAAKESLSDHGDAPDDDAPFADATAEDPALDDTAYDDGGLDLAVDEGIDDAFAADAADDVPASLDGNDFEDLL